jgi:NADPH2 dehydrogenase
MKKINDHAELIQGLKARNRIVMPSMATVMAKNGLANDFHIQHYGAKAYGGVGTILIEATAVSSEGRILDADLGI